MGEKQIDIEEIMCEIRAQAKEHPVVEPMPTYTILHGDDCGDLAGELDHLINELKTQRDIPSERPIQGNAGSRFIKKIVRKLTRFYFAPVVSDQNKYNQEVLESLEKIRGLLEKYTIDDSNAPYSFSELSSIVTERQTKEILQIRNEQQLLKEELAALRKQLKEE